VSAKDKATSKEQSIRIEGSSGLDKTEIDEMMHQAEAHAADDKERRERIDARNGLDSLVYEAQKLLNEHREKIPVSDLNALESSISDAKSLLEQEDAPLAELKSKFDEIQGGLHKVSQVLYQQQAESGGPGAEPAGAAQGGGNGDPDVVDAEFTEEK
jgi:molecular chaperone DnaK